MSDKPKGQVIIIGGHEDKEGDKIILTEVAAAAKRGGGRIVVLPVASELPEEMADQYRKVFGELGVSQIDIVDIRTRDEATESERVDAIANASAIFFTGGDQLRITSQIGDTPLYRCIREIYHNGGTIVGTSAGAAAMPETMLIGGPSDSSADISALRMAPGLALVNDVVVDSHFAERGRIGRLLGAVSQNPRNLGLGIDEDTAIVVRHDHFRVLGSGAVYVVDGTGVSYSSLSEHNPEGVVRMSDIKLHILGHGDKFDLIKRRPKFVNSDKEQKSASE